MRKTNFLVQQVGHPNIVSSSLAVPEKYVSNEVINQNWTAARAKRRHAETCSSVNNDSSHFRSMLSPKLHRQSNMPDSCLEPAGSPHCEAPDIIWLCKKPSDWYQSSRWSFSKQTIAITGPAKSPRAQPVESPSLMLTIRHQEWNILRKSYRL